MSSSEGDTLDDDYIFIYVLFLSIHYIHLHVLVTLLSRELNIVHHTCHAAYCVLIRCKLSLLHICFVDDIFWPCPIVVDEHSTLALAQ